MQWGGVGGTVGRSGCSALRSGEVRGRGLLHGHRGRRSEKQNRGSGARGKSRGTRARQGGKEG